MRVRKTAGWVLAAMIMQAVSLPAGAQGAGRMEAVMQRNVTLPQTAWIKAEVLGASATEQKLRADVDLLLRQRGYTPEAFSPYAVRIELRGLDVDPVAPAIPHYANVQERLSLWNAAAAPGSVTVSLILYHQSSGRVLWQAEGSCASMDAAALSASMVVPLMNSFGQTSRGELSCLRSL